ncbi:MAG: FAD-dependent oxidoreductase [Rhodospirillales bacterium]|nr:FAD-dependent oxidoreductase [Rhodospirillales bacterium]
MAPDRTGDTYRDTYDVVVIGAGAGGMAAACLAAARGLRVLLSEAAPQIGGTTAISGGMMWMPGNHVTSRAGAPDRAADARAYLAATVPLGANAAVREAFLAHASEAVADLEIRTELRFRPVRRYPDYYPDLPGASLGGRVLEAERFDARLLGADFALLRPPLPEFMLFGRMMVAREDLPSFLRVGRSWSATARVARLLAAYAGQRLRHPRGTTLVLGNALAGRLLLSLRRLGVTLRLGTSAVGLLARDGAIIGARLAGPEGGAMVRAARGVVLATGGFSHDAALRARLLPGASGSLSATVASDAGDGIRLGCEAGGRLESGNANHAFWVPASRYRRRNGSDGVFPHTVTDRGKPGLIAVNRAGRRFVNEALSYHEFVLAMLRDANAAPAWLVCDRDFLWRYGLGVVRPFALSLRWPIGSGYLLRGATIPALATAAGIDPDSLAATVARFNGDAARGEDPEFGRGGDAYQRHMGDASVVPNPCVRPILHPPFFAVRVEPADLGTATGLAVDASARVLGADGAPIPGLFACGNDMASVMNGAYPGPGITLGPALTFAYLAARRLADE